MAVRRVSDLDIDALRGREFFPSPVAWEDQVLYFLMLDRFSSGEETDAFRPEDAESAVRAEEDAARWREAGRGWVGGTLRGLTGRIGYLQRLGVTAIWVSPVLKQVESLATYHGYGIQDFLDVDPHFGTTDDLRDMVAVAHEHGIRVILDIILNHAGNVFSYDADRYSLHKIQAQGGDPVVKRSTASRGSFKVPGRTTAVFVGRTRRRSGRRRASARRAAARGGRARRGRRRSRRTAARRGRGPRRG